MAVQKFKYIILLLMCSCASANSVDIVNTVKIDNQLSQCITATHIKIDKEGKIPILSFDLRIDKDIAECGCKSALGSYTVYTQMDGYKSYIIGGKVGFVKSGKKSLPLSSEQKLIGKRELIVGFSCAQPD